MKIPKKIRMFGYVWRVVVDKDSPQGSYCWRTKTITLPKRDGEEELVFFHELLEAILVHLHYRYYGQEHSMQYEFHMDHNGMHKVSQQLWQILSDNNLLK